MKRLKITVHGQVQRVGYRDTVTDMARQLGIRGTVRNLEDEVTVEIIAEGEEKLLDEFVKLITIKKYPIEVEKTNVHIEKATGEFQYFKIIRGEGFSELGERLDTAGKLLYKSLEKQDQMLEKLDSGFKEVGTKLDKTNENLGNKLDKFSEATQHQFNHLDMKYGKVSEKLGSIDNHLKELVDTLRAFKPK